MSKLLDDIKAIDAINYLMKKYSLTEIFEAIDHLKNELLINKMNGDFWNNIDDDNNEFYFDIVKEDEND